MRKIDPLELYTLGPGSVVMQQSDPEDAPSVVQRGPSGYWVPVGAPMAVSPESVASGVGELFVIHEVEDKRSDRDKLAEMYPLVREYLTEQLPDGVKIQKSQRRGYGMMLNISYFGETDEDLAHRTVVGLLVAIGIGTTRQSIDDCIQVKAKA